MPKKLFIGGLSWNVSDPELREAFEKLGEVVDAKVVVDRDSGRSRGFGFVTYAEDEAAERAIAEMDGVEIDGRAVHVSEARERPAREGRGGGGGGGGGGGRGGRGGGRGGGPGGGRRR